jgi:hypothetical protein
VTGDSDKQLPRAIFAATKSPPKALEERINGHPSMEFLKHTTYTVLGRFYNFLEFSKI